jgi:hypothetical protein
MQATGLIVDALAVDALAPGKVVRFSTPTKAVAPTPTAVTPSKVATSKKVAHAKPTSTAKK